MRLAVGIATTGRADILRSMLPLLAAQSRKPDHLFLSPVAPEDIDLESLAGLPFPVSILPSRAGSCPQRNAILDACSAMDAIIFLDDDFFAASTYLEHAENLLTQESDVVLATGILIDDGINGPGIDPEAACRKLKELGPCAISESEPYYGVYGCNMVARLEPIRAANIGFDEALPLYGWQEDIDFSRQLAPFGRIVRSAALTGVHLGTKRGRTSGVRFGYSQIANPIYLMRKGTMSLRFGFQTMAKNIAANCLRSLRPEPWVDRGGRATGNVRAIFDLARGRLHPTRILEL